MTPHVIDIITRVVFIASILHNALPPWEFLNDFPRIQKVYKVLVYIVGFVAVNGRSTIYQSISIQKTGGVNESVVHAEGPKEK